MTPPRTEASGWSRRGAACWLQGDALFAGSIGRASAQRTDRRDGTATHTAHQMRRNWAPVWRWWSCAARSSGVSTRVSAGRCLRTSARGPW